VKHEKRIDYLKKTEVFPLALFSVISMSSVAYANGLMYNMHILC